MAGPPGQSGAASRGPESREKKEPGRGLMESRVRDADVSASDCRQYAMGHPAFLPGLLAPWAGIPGTAWSLPDSFLQPEAWKSRPPPNRSYGRERRGEGMSKWMLEVKGGMKLGFFFFFFFFRAAPTAYGGSQATGRIGAAAARLQHSHSNVRSESHL